MKKQVAIDVNRLLDEVVSTQAKLDDKSVWGNSRNLRRLLKAKWMLAQQKTSQD